MTQTILGLGSNEGDSRVALLEALRLLEAAGVGIFRRSSFYRTSPVGGVEQGDFVNAVVVAETDFSAKELLAVVKNIEKSMGRSENAIRWGPRPIDIDILLYGTDEISEPELVVPHPRIAERLFALVPLEEVAGGFLMPSGEKVVDFCMRMREAENFSLQTIEKIL